MKGETAFDEVHERVSRLARRQYSEHQLPEAGCSQCKQTSGDQVESIVGAALRLLGFLEVRRKNGKTKGCLRKSWIKVRVVGSQIQNTIEL